MRKFFHLENRSTEAPKVDLNSETQSTSPWEILAARMEKARKNPTEANINDIVKPILNVDAKTSQSPQSISTSPWGILAARMEKARKDPSEANMKELLKPIYVNRK